MDNKITNPTHKKSKKAIIKIIYVIIAIVLL